MTWLSEERQRHKEAAEALWKRIAQLKAMPHKGGVNLVVSGDGVTAVRGEQHQAPAEAAAPISPGGSDKPDPTYQLQPLLIPRGNRRWLYPLCLGVALLVGAWMLASGLSLSLALFVVVAILGSAAAWIHGLLRLLPDAQAISFPAELQRLSGNLDRLLGPGYLGSRALMRRASTATKSILWAVSVLGICATAARLLSSPVGADSPLRLLLAAFLLMSGLWMTIMLGYERALRALR
jgi:hypothetical protein